MILNSIGCQKHRIGNCECSDFFQPAPLTSISSCRARSVADAMACNDTWLSARSVTGTILRSETLGCPRGSYHLGRGGVRQEVD